MVCVKTVSYSILVIGEPHGLLHPTRGIRQGDPLSPFLFLLNMQGLHGLIQQATRVGGIKGFSLCRRGPELSHLLFADDSLLFCRATPEECDKVLGNLDCYEEASCQNVNKNKTSIFFSCPLWRTLDKRLKVHWAYKKLRNMRNTLDSHPWLAERNKIASITSKKRY